MLHSVNVIRQVNETICQCSQATFWSVITVKVLEANTKGCEVLASSKDYAVTN